MAEINIERKKKSMWPWVILLLVIIGLIAWAIYELVDEEERVEYEEVPATGMVVPLKQEQVPTAITPV